MGDTFIPGDDLEQLTRLLPHIKDLLSAADAADQKYAGFLGVDGEATFGDQGVSFAVTNFHLKWSDGHYQLGKEVDNLDGIANNILSSFQQTDQDLVDELEGKTPPDQSGVSSPGDGTVTLASPPPKFQGNGEGGRPPSKEN